MNKTKTIILLASSLALLACSQSGGKESYSAPTGTEVGKEELNVHYAKALTAMEEANAFGVSATGDLKVNAETKGSVKAGEIATETSSSTKVELTNLSASVGMKTVDENVKISAKANGDYIIETKANESTLSSQESLSLNGKASVAAYYADNTVYADFSGAESLFKLFSSDSSAETPLKFKTTVETPKFDWSFITEAMEDLSKSASQSEYIQAKDGAYSFVYTIDPKSISGSVSSVDTGADWSGSIKVWLSFTEGGFTEAGATGSISYNGSVSYSMEGYSYSSSTSGEVSVNLKATFSYGDKVTVDEVSNPDDFVYANSQED